MPVIAVQHHGLTDNSLRVRYALYRWLIRTFGTTVVKFREPLREAPCRVAAVSPVPEQPVTWVVRGADGARPNRQERFTGSDAMLRSLRYAHDEYSRVRWFLN